MLQILIVSVDYVGKEINSKDENRRSREGVLQELIVAIICVGEETSKRTSGRSRSAAEVDSKYKLCRRGVNESRGKKKEW